MTDRRQATRRSSPYGLFTLLAILMAGGVVALLRWQWTTPWLLAYLTGLNIATLLLYAYDKAASRRDRHRVPERVLHLVTLAGGTPAALLGQIVLRHKTVKPSFRRWLFIIVFVQVVAVAAWVYWRYH